ncbi:hypothetical protein [Bacillus taeanensis]|uniref:Uncharacterized protein n=1 Tax=Bacillus taeanensis TaxID=273032 RepID=A0A366XZC4_9BACI|nr:hypothetical protein [Bacillus taeanensis]RBW70956.1 hypothetical protein DS031_02880 [Bacillus taeanensis]
MSCFHSLSEVSDYINGNGKGWLNQLWKSRLKVLKQEQHEWWNNIRSNEESSEIVYLFKEHLVNPIEFLEKLTIEYIDIGSNRSDYMHMECTFKGEDYEFGVHEDKEGTLLHLIKIADINKGRYLIKYYRTNEVYDFFRAVLIDFFIMLFMRYQQDYGKIIKYG